MNLRDVTVSSVKEAREDGEYVSEVKLNGERIGWVRQLGKHGRVTGFEAYTVRQQIIEGTPRNQREAAQIVKREYLRIKARDESMRASELAELGDRLAHEHLPIEDSPHGASIDVTESDDELEEVTDDDEPTDDETDAEVPSAPVLSEYES